MKHQNYLAWNYSRLASTYDLRADYHAGLINESLDALGVTQGDLTIEVGAGTGKLTQLLCRRQLKVVACEPNASMRSVALGKQCLSSVKWLACRGEALALRSGVARLVAYGSSFNVLPAHVALNECARVLAAGGHWLALWNHRDLNDSFQQEVETVIKQHIPNYDYGTRRQSPSSDVLSHGAFDGLEAAERRFLVQVSPEDWMLAWQSHATLERQAGSKFPSILKDLHSLVDRETMLQVPYFTRLWTARRKAV